MKWRLAITVFFTILLMSLGSASHDDTNHEISISPHSGSEINYGESIDIFVSCDSCIRLNMEVEICEDNAFRPTMDSSQNFLADIPEDYSCGYGEHTATFKDSVGHVHDEETIFVHEDSTEKPHRGKYLYVNMNADPGLNSPENQLRSFHLSDDTWSHSSPDQGHIMVQDYDSLSTSDRVSLKAELGATASGGDSIGDLIESGQDLPGDTHNVVYKDFNRQNTQDFNFFSVSKSPLHSIGEYWPNGEIIVGNYPEYHVNVAGFIAEGEYSEEGPFFFICREGAVMDNKYGVNVPQVVDVIEDDGQMELYRCDQDNGQWVGPSEVTQDNLGPATECNSGLDHDGDGGIDAPGSWYHEETEDDKQHDPDCSGLTDNSESEGGNECRQGVTKEEYITPDGAENTEIITAQFETEDGCSTEGQLEYFEDSELRLSEWKEEPETYTCQTDHQNPDEYAEFCDGLTYYEDGQMPIVDFYAEPDYFEQLAEAQDKDLSNEVVETGFVNSDGWTTQRQSLLNAEQSYSGTSHGEHEYSGWEPRITGVNNNGEQVAALAYDNDYSDSGEHLEAWTVANAGATNDEIMSETGPQQNNEQFIFEGGFAGECEGVERWQYEEEGLDEDWRCGAGLDWEQPVMLPQTEDDDMVGLIVPHTNLFEDSDDFEETEVPMFDSYPVASAYTDDFGDLQSLSARCWAGTLDDDPGDEDVPDVEVSSISVSGDASFGFYSDLEHDGSYACSWGYQSSPMPDIGAITGTQDDLIRLGAEYDEGTFDYEVKEGHRELIENFDRLEEGQGPENMELFESLTENMELQFVEAN